MNWCHPHEALSGDCLNPPSLILIWYLPAWKCTSSGSQFMLELAALPVRAPANNHPPPSPPIHTQRAPRLQVRCGRCNFGHGFVVVWGEGVSCRVLFVSRAWQTHAGTHWGWATNHSWNGYRHGVPMGFLYQVTSQNNIGQYFKWRNEGFWGWSQPGVWDSVWNSWICSSAFDLHGRWAIKCMKHIGNTWGNSPWPCYFLGIGRALSELPLTSHLSSQQDYAWRRANLGKEIFPLKGHCYNSLSSPIRRYFLGGPFGRTVTLSLEMLNAVPTRENRGLNWFNFVWLVCCGKPDLLGTLKYDSTTRHPAFCETKDLKNWLFVG